MEKPALQIGVEYGQAGRQHYIVLIENGSLYRFLQRREVVKQVNRIQVKSMRYSRDFSKELDDFEYIIWTPEAIKAVLSLLPNQKHF